MARGSVPPPLTKLFPRHLHGDLAKIQDRLRKRGIDLEALAGALNHHVTADAGVKKLRALRADQARADRMLLHRFRAVLGHVRDKYVSDRQRARLTMSPIHRHVAAILAYYERFDQAQQALRRARVLERTDERKMTKRQRAELARKRRVLAQRIRRVDWGDPMAPPAPSRTGPRRWAIHEALAQLHVPREDRRWLIQNLPSTL